MGQPTLAVARRLTHRRHYSGKHESSHLNERRQSRVSKEAGVAAARRPLHRPTIRFGLRGPAYAWSSNAGLAPAAAQHMHGKACRQCAECLRTDRHSSSQW